MYQMIFERRPSPHHCLGGGFAVVLGSADNRSVSIRYGYDKSRSIGATGPIATGPSSPAP
jgi:hypothetical protein